MKRIRIGKDISMRWEITTDGVAIPLEGRDLTIEIKSPAGIENNIPYRVDGNILIMTYYGYEQKRPGEYSITLWEKKGKPGQNVVDVIRAFELVRTSQEENDFVGGDLQIESVDLGTENFDILTEGGYRAINIDTLQAEALEDSVNINGKTYSNESFTITLPKANLDIAGVMSASDVRTLKEHAASILNLNTDVSKLKDKDIETSSSLSELNTKVDTLKSQAYTNTSNISSLNTEVSTLRGKVDVNTTSISQINNTIADHGESISQINTKLEEHTESINANITTDRIEDGAVTSDKISTSAFDDTLSVSGKIAPADVVGRKLSDLGVKTSEISKETIETDDASIDIEDSNGNKLFHLDEEGLDAKNVKSNGKSVLTEYQDISGLATKEDVNGKQDVIPQVSQEYADSSESEQIFASDDYNNEDGTGEVYAKIGEYGVEAKNLVDTLNLNCNEICDYYAIGSSGNHTLVSGRGCSHYIACKGATRMHVRMIQEPSASGYGLAFYDDSKAFVSFVPNPIGEQGIKDVELRIPKNASYFRTTYYNFENSKIYGEFEGMLLYRKGILGNSKYRPYQEGNIYFSQKINQSPYSWKETDASVKLPVNEKVTTGVLLLPRSYTPNGKKTKLIMYCHGYSHGVYYGTWGSTSNFQTQKEHWADMGFAVMDCNGARDSNRQASGANNYATAPQNVDAYHKCYEYIIENYNIAPGIYIVGGSMGGQVCMQYCYTHGNNIRACVLLSAHVDSHTWFDTAHPKGDLWGVEGDVTGSMIDAESTKDVFCGYVPEARYVDIAGKKYNLEFPCSVMALWGEQETGSIIIEKMRNLIEILRNSGYEATCRMIEGLAHSDVVSGANMVVDTEIANWFNRK